MTVRIIRRFRWSKHQEFIVQTRLRKIAFGTPNCTPLNESVETIAKTKNVENEGAQGDPRNPTSTSTVNSEGLRHLPFKTLRVRHTFWLQARNAPAPLAATSTQLDAEPPP